MGYQILVTRPEPENTLTCRAIEHVGHRPIALPMLEITPITDQASQAAIRSQIFNIDEFHYVIFVSKNAARIACDYLDECWPMLPVGVHWLGIGQGTTQALIDQGIPALSHPGHTSEELLHWLKPARMRDQKILIVRGVGGRTTLGDSLIARGAKVSYLNLYERKKPTYFAQTFTMLPDINMIWVTSGEGLSNLTDYAQQYMPSWFTLPIMTPSARVTAQAKSLEWTNVICSSGADDTSLIAATNLYKG
ncbi:uroporphyrinogen-III synthase [Marinomonas epiphytica]